MWSIKKKQPSAESAGENQLDSSEFHSRPILFSWRVAPFRWKLGGFKLQGDTTFSDVLKVEVKEKRKKKKALTLFMFKEGGGEEGGAAGGGRSRQSQGGAEFKYPNDDE